MIKVKICERVLVRKKISKKNNKDKIKKKIYINIQNKIKENQTQL